MPFTSPLPAAKRGLTLLAAVFPLAASLPALAQTTDASAGRAPHIAAVPGTDDALRAYWTPDRIAHAKLLDMHIGKRLPLGHNRAVSNAAREIVHGGLPTASYDQDLSTESSDSLPQIRLNGHASPQITGGSGQPFTTNKLYPSTGADLYKAYPYGTVGHLYFTEPSGDFQCSASVIRANVIATAGHCVADGNGHYYTNWVFIPAQNGTKQPYGMWTWSDADTTSAWWSGGGGVPNEQDDALIILNTRTVKKVAHRVADYTGYLGYEYNAPIPYNITQLGYPCNLDSCSDPVATYAQLASGPTNTFLWGSAEQGGASGGPIIADFGQAPSGVPSETLGGNIVVASFSFYYTASGYFQDGASIFYAPGQNGEYTFGDLINWACSGTTNC